MVEAPLVEKMSKLFLELKADDRLNDVVTRPHPLLIAASRGEMMVVVAPADVWEKGRDLLKPFAKRFADSTAMVILLGYPPHVDLAQAMNVGLASIVSATPTK